MSDIQHNLFLPTCCNPCLICPTPATTETVNPVKLLKCLGCKLVLYCSTAHQKLDWPIHKRFCQAVGTLLAEHKINHLFAIAGPIRTKIDLSEVTVKIKYKLVTLLKRPLDYHEEELTSFPVMCCVCFSTKYNNLYQCKKCNAVSYCCPLHEEDYAPIHQTECLQLKLHYCKFKIDSNLIFNLKLKRKCKLFKSDLSKTMAHMFGIDLVSDPSESLVEYQKFSFASDFSCIATISYVAEYLKNYQKFGREFTLFIAGSKSDDIWFTPLHTEFFFVCFPDISHLNVIFIGPEIPNKHNNETTTILDNGRTLLRKFFQGTIEMYLEMSKNDLKPDMIVCFNCGFSENPRTDGPSESWYKGLQQLIDLPDVPILFTSYTSLEADSDLRALEKVVEDRKDNLYRLQEIIGKQQNPYRDMRPLRNWQSNDIESIFYRNGYIHVVKIIYQN
ncbi:uncharacterized protein LOC129916808 [Episyrphus balteatus]|uniref:uncharacterized protein LOC129916808 n=1 Tax=Episyrphus balteatus TaxID=286459 RepID=UPI0024862427|nr:uncharacterized protein LOC129916808 [Episyrphus balteatus]